MRSNNILLQNIRSLNRIVVGTKHELATLEIAFTETELNDNVETSVFGGNHPIMITKRLRRSGVATRFQKFSHRNIVEIKIDKLQLQLIEIKVDTKHSLVFQRRIP